MGLTVVKLSLNLLLWGLIQAVATNGGLSWVSVNVPQYRVPGDTALLQCNYDLGNGSLYSVKWYKDHEEFYRFVPKTRPQATAYRVQGATVDLSKSDSRKVVLHPVDWKTSGLYRCEVSAEAPAFSSAQSESRMEVICDELGGADPLPRLPRPQRSDNDNPGPAVHAEQPSLPRRLHESEVHSVGVAGAVAHRQGERRPESADQGHARGSPTREEFND